MEFRNPSELGIPSSPPPPPPPGYNPALLRAGSAFSKPTQSPPPNLVSPRGGGGGGGARNGNILGNPRPPPPGQALELTPAATDQAPKSSGAAPVATVYRECLRNHAAAIGGHVVDGCGEFMPGGDAETPEALNCAACGCHRSFHRKESGSAARGGGVGGSGSGSYARLPALLPPPHPLHHQKQFQFGGFSSPSSAGFVHFGGVNPSGSGGTTTESSSEEMLNSGAPASAAAPRKRFRTKFTAEQKDKMLAFAERIGWRFQRQDYAMVEQFCAEIGVRRQVLKVWMHNNKNTATRKPPPQQQPLPSPPREEQVQVQQQYDQQQQQHAAPLPQQ